MVGEERRGGTLTDMNGYVVVSFILFRNPKVLLGLFLNRGGERSSWVVGYLVWYLGGERKEGEGH